MSPPVPHDDAIDDAAAGWFARQRAGDMTAPEREALEAWLNADPAYRAALDALDRAWRRAELARHDPEIMAWRELAVRRPRPRVFLARAMAAMLALAVIGGGGTFVLAKLGVLPGTGRLTDQAFRTDLGQRVTISLADGSKVTLNTDTVLRTRAAEGRRLVYLDRGQAFFRVAHDRSRPFIVTAGGRTITAIGTAFDVRVDPRRFEVTLVEGKVRVEAPAPPPLPLKRPGSTKAAAVPPAAPATQATEIAAGSQLVASDDRGWSVRQADTARETAWLTGRLMFENERLGAVVGEFARYSDRRIVLDDPSLAQLPVSGTFRSGDVDTFVRALQEYRLARVESRSDAEIHLAAY